MIGALLFHYFEMSDFSLPFFLDLNFLFKEAWFNMFAHLIKTQHKTQGPSDELNLVCRERVSHGPYHNGPNSEIGTVAEETIT